MILTAASDLCALGQCILRANPVRFDEIGARNRPLSCTWAEAARVAG